MYFSHLARATHLTHRRTESHCSSAGTVTAHTITLHSISRQFRTLCDIYSNFKQYTSHSTYASSTAVVAMAKGVAIPEAIPKL